VTRMSITAQPTYLDPQVLASVASLDMRARMIVEGIMTGMHRSPFFGYSVEFAQHRQYAPGDDIRHLDWKVFGRSDKLYLKQYQKETNLRLVLLVDTSGSMAYGSDAVKGWRKYDYAATMAATFAHLALRQQDRVSLVLFADQMRQSTRLSNARDHWRTIVDTLGSVTPQDDEPLYNQQNMDDGLPERMTNLGRMFEQVVAKLTRRSVIVLISDLFDNAEALQKGLARLRHRRHDVMVLQVVDHAELTFPFRSPSEFFGLEAEGKLPLDPAALRDAYLEVFNEHLRSVQDVTQRFGFDYMMLDTSQPLGPPLSRFLAIRTAAADRKHL